jgi:integrase
MASFQTDKGQLLIAYRWQRKLYRRYLGCKASRKNERHYEQLRRDVTYDERSGHDPDHRFAHRGQVATLPAAPGLTVSQVAKAWLWGQHHLSPKASKEYGYLLGHYLDELQLPETGGTLGELDPRTLRRDQIIELIKGRAPALTRKFLQRMRTVVDEQLVGNGIVTTNVFRLVKNPKKVEVADQDEGPIEPLSETEQVRLLNAVQGQDRLIIAIGLGCGLRPSEILSIQYQDIDLAHHVLYVRGTKTTGSKRWVKLRGRVLEMLRAHLGANPAQIGRMFSGVKMHRPIRLHKWREYIWNPALVAAGLKHQGPMSMRHTFAISRLDAGDAPSEVAKELGHTNTSTIHRHYGRFVQRMDEAIRQ